MNKKDIEEIVEEINRNYIIVERPDIADCYDVVLRKADGTHYNAKQINAKDILTTLTPTKTDKQ